MFRRLSRKNAIKLGAPMTKAIIFPPKRGESRKPKGMELLPCSAQYEDEQRHEFIWSTNIFRLYTYSFARMKVKTFITAKRYLLASWNKLKFQETEPKEQTVRAFDANNACARGCRLCSM